MRAIQSTRRGWFTPGRWYLTRTSWNGSVSFGSWSVAYFAVGLASGIGGVERRRVRELLLQ
jgi:hypothetical protein